MRKLYLTLLLPLFLLLSQQGALLHELSHYSDAESSSQRQKQHPNGDACDDCLSFAHILGAVKPDVQAPRLLPDLAHHLAATVLAQATQAAAPVPRSRGPPALL